MYLSIDEVHILLVLTSTTDFQSVSLGLVWKRIINLILALLTNLMLATLLFIIVFWLPQLNVYSEKTSPCDWIRPRGISLSTFLHKIFPSSHHISPLWTGNYTPFTTTWGLTNNLNTMLTIALLLIFLLAVSLAYEWTQKGLEWTEYGI